MNGRITSIDALKGLAIIAVLLLHSLDSGVLSWIRSSTHIGQAVPVFVMVTFYLSFLSMEKREGAVLYWYSPERCLRMVKRIVLPFIIVLFIQCLLLLFTSHFSLPTLIKNGGYGPGSYYIWVYLQIWFLAPLLYLLLEKYEIVGCIIVYVICIALNILCSYCCPNELWRLLSVRYLSLSVIAWIWRKSKQINGGWKVILFSMGILSLVYLLFFVSFDASPFIYYGQWGSQNYPVYFWTLLLVLFFDKFVSFLPRILNNCLVWLGKNSWEVFLAQMFFVGCVSIKRFPYLSNPVFTQVFYVLFVFTVSIGSVFVWQCFKREKG